MVRYRAMKRYLISVTLVVWVDWRHSQLVLVDEIGRTNGAIRDIEWHLTSSLYLVLYRLWRMSLLDEVATACVAM